MIVALSRMADNSCMASARRLRSEAECLRDNADLDELTPRQRTALLREAHAADRRADWWLSAAERH